MEKYINRDKAIAYVEEQYRLFKNDEGKQNIVEGCVEALKFTPVADVAPRSEVAREIFKEINKLYAVLDDYDDIYIGSLRIDLAELEKKYTQERESESDKSLDSVIKTCEEVSKEGNKRDCKEKDSIDKDER